MQGEVSKESLCFIVLGRKSIFYLSCFFKIERWPGHILWTPAFGRDLWVLKFFYINNIIDSLTVGWKWKKKISSETTHVLKERVAVHWYKYPVSFANFQATILPGILGLMGIFGVEEVSADGYSSPFSPHTVIVQRMGE